MSDWNSIDTPYDEILNDLPEDMRDNFPDVDIIVQSGETIILNFNSIITQIKRESNHLKKFISSELGVKTSIKGTQLVIKSKLDKNRITQTLKIYIDKFIICDNCGKPDTILKGNKKNMKITCAACGYSKNL